MEKIIILICLVSIIGASMISREIRLENKLEMSELRSTLTSYEEMNKILRSDVSRIISTNTEITSRLMEELRDVTGNDYIFDIEGKLIIKGGR